jgi:flagellar biosynthesis/type III secretory pathway M-ring protein FliF/YscJ
LLGAILTMIGYYVIILTAAMILIMVVVQIFKAFIARRKHDESAAVADGSAVRAEETGEEFAVAAIAAVSCVLGTERQFGVSAWSAIERSVFSPWKIASRSRRIRNGGG